MFNNVKILNKEYSSNRKKKTKADLEEFVEIDKTLVHCSFFQVLAKKEEEKWRTFQNDEVTGMRYLTVPQDNGIGQESLTRNWGVVCGEDIQLPYTLLLVSEKALTLDKNSMHMSDFLQKRGVCLFNKHVFNMEGPVQLVNTRRALSESTVEIENVGFAICSNETIYRRWKYVLPNGYYAVVFNLVSIVNGQFLIFKDYGSQSSMMFGKDEYVLAQQECYRVFRERLEGNVGTDRAVCYKCLEVVESGIFHNETCVPYMRNYFVPAPRKLSLSDVDYFNLKSKYDSYIGCEH